MKRLVLTFLAAFAVAAAPAHAPAAFVFTLTQASGNVTLTGSGALNTTGLTSVDNGTYSAVISPSSGTLYGGPMNQMSFNVYGGLTGGPTSFGTGNQTFANSGSGNLLGVSNGYLVIPPNYVSSTALSNAAMFTDATFASLDYTLGTYIYTLPSGDTLTINSVVPEPSTWAMLGVGAGASSLALHRRRAVRVT